MKKPYIFLKKRSNIYRYHRPSVYDEEKSAPLLCACVYVYLNIHFLLFISVSVYKFTFKVSQVTFWNMELS